jgi:hypothetical protein
MSSVVFVGIALELESVTQISLSTLRVRFTQEPLQANPAGTNDALNALNWSITGPGSSAVSSCAVVSGDLQSIDLILAGPLTLGTWTITASSAIQTATASPIQEPKSLTFIVTNAGSIDPVNAGSTNDTDEEIIRKHLNAALAGDGWNALIAAIATGERKNRENAEAAFDQLFTSTASGLYLERKASDAGIERPINMGMSDDTFRQYTIRITNNKLTEESFLEILEVFYGDSSVRASNSSAQIEPYVFQDGDDMTFIVDEEVTVPIVFTNSDFAIPSQAKAVEVAAAITRACRTAGSLAYAAPTVDPQTGIAAVTIFSGALGLSSSIRVLGGKAQNVLQFADLLDIYTGVSSPTWNITVDAARGVMRFTTTSSAVNLSLLQENDYVNIYGTEFDAANRGSFTVTSVSVTYPAGVLTQWFEVVIRDAVQQLGLVQTAQADLLYFRSTRKTIHATSERAVIVSVPGNEADVILPATSQAVSRHEKTAAYLQLPSSIDITSLERISGVVTAIAPSHGLSVGSLIDIQDAVGINALPATVSGNGTTTTDYSHTSVSTLLTGSTGTQLRKYPTVASFSDGTIYVAGGLNGAAVNQNAEALAFSSSTVQPQGTQYTVSKPTQSNTGSKFAFCAGVLSHHPSTSGKIVLFGGTDLATDNNSTLLVSNGSSTSGANMSFAVAAPMAVELNDFSIFSFGGAIAGVGTNTSQSYNPLTNTWTTKASMTSNRVQAGFVHTVDALLGEIVVVTGGRTLATGLLNYTSTADMGPILNTVEVYVPNSWAFSGIRMTYARFGHQLFALGNGRYLVIGGWGYRVSGSSTTPARLATCEIIDQSGSHVINPMRNGRAFFATAQFGNKLYVAGGTPSSTDVEILNLDTLEWSLSTAKLNVAVDKTAGAKLTNGMFVIVNGEVSTASDDKYRIVSLDSEIAMTGDLNGTRKVTNVINPNTFQFKTNTQSYTKTGAAVGYKNAAATGDFAGPFSFDVDGDVSVTSVESNLTADVNKGLQYDSLSVADASVFPDENGWLALDFGYEDAVYPIKYFGRLSTTKLALDYSFRFPKTVTAGAKVCLLQQKGPWVPPNPAAVGSFYVTDSPAGRIAAEQAINASAAAGLTINVTVTYPGDRGLGNEGYPASGNYKVSDKVEVWGSDDVDADLIKARE